MDVVKAVSYYYKKGSSEGYDRPTLDVMYVKAKERYPNLEIVEYLCDNNKSFSAYDRVVELIVDHGIRCILTPSVVEASYTADESLNNFDWLFALASGVEVFDAKRNHFYTEDNHFALKLLAIVAENQRKLRLCKHNRKSDNNSTN